MARSSRSFTVSQTLGKVLIILFLLQLMHTTTMPPFRQHLVSAPSSAQQGQKKDKFRLCFSPALHHCHHRHPHHRQRLRHHHHHLPRHLPPLHRFRRLALSARPMADVTCISMGLQQPTTTQSASSLRLAETSAVPSRVANARPTTHHAQFLGLPLAPRQTHNVLTCSQRDGVSAS